MAIVLGLLLALQTPTGIDSVVQSGIAAGVYPGAVVVVGSSDRIWMARGVGHFTWDEASAVPDPATTLFDLASLTKVLATTTAIMLLADRGHLALQDPVARYLPDFVGPDKEQVTVRHLLEHRSGMRSFLRLDTLARDAVEARRLVVTEPLRAPPGTRTEYSDLNAMLLGWVVEAVSGETLDRYAAREIFDPLEMRDTRFRPPRSLRASTMPVGQWRGHAIAGEIHDQNAARLNGVSGHAGLYATGRDVARFAQFMLRRGRTASAEVLARPGVIDLFVRRGVDDRALGWEMRDTATTDNTGRKLSPATYGHTGFTGTSLWIDPERDMFVVLLTNRVFAPRTRRSISILKAVRGAVADAAVTFVDACRRAPGACGNGAAP
jgi:CubicO group peptidase (beta-lactamase class C family)